MLFGGEDGEVAGVTITSTLGGNARLRVGDELAGADGLVLRSAEGENPNAFYATERTTSRPKLERRTPCDACEGNGRRPSSHGPRSNPAPEPTRALLTATHR